MASHSSSSPLLIIFLVLLINLAASSNPHPRLERAHAALQAWKLVIYSDPFNFTSDWHGPDVCRYTGVYCAPHPDDPSSLALAGIDLNHGDIAGILPDSLGLLSDLALLHLSSNRFCGPLPLSLSNLSLLHELDLSNNRLVGPFPSVVLSLPSLRYLDIRFNEFEGPLPPQLFRGPLDAVFVNSNRFESALPRALGSSSASVLVLANNRFDGGWCVDEFASTALEELLLINASLEGCLPPEVGLLRKLRVLDVSSNRIVGPVPGSLFDGLTELEVLNLGRNEFGGAVPEGVCELPSLKNFTFSDNYFCEEPRACRNRPAFDDRGNCLPEKGMQRSKRECEGVKPVDCFEIENECV